MPRLSGLSAIIPSNPRILILGSFPSTKSLEEQQYYAKRSNRFWKLIGSACGAGDYTDRPYRDKLNLLEHARIALWDVVATCERQGASDSKIRNPKWNDISGLVAKHPNIKQIIINGSTAGNFYEIAVIDRSQWAAHSPLSVQCLSTSAANQRYGPWNKLVEDWMPYLHN